MTRRLSILLLLLAPLVPLWRAVFVGQAIGPFDQIRQMAPWNGPKPDQPWDVLQADSVLQFYPWRDMVFEAWGKHQLPLWNPYELAGTPLLANSQSAGFYPAHIILGLVHFPTALAITLLAWAHLVLAGLGVFFLVRSLGGSRIGATIAGLSFSLSPFMVGWTGLSSVITTVAWIPWLLGFIVSMFRDHASSRLNQLEEASAYDLGRRMASRQRTYRVGAAFATALMLLGGHLQFAAYGIIAAVLLTLGLVATTRERTRFKPVLAIVGALVAGGLLAAPQIVPVLNYGKFSHRRNSPTDEGYQAYLKDAIKPFELATLTVPTALGNPRSPIDVGGATIQQYWPPLVKPGDNFAESALGIGPIILAGLFLVPWKRREVWPIAFVGCVALLLALGTALNWPLYFLMPGWSSTGSPGRVIVLFVLAACVLGGLGLDSTMSLGKTGWIKVAIALAFGLLLAFGGPSLAPAGSEAFDQIRSAATSAMLPVALISLVLAAAGIALLTAGSSRKLGLLAVFAPILLCWLGYGSDLVMTGKPLAQVSGVTADARVAFINKPWSLNVGVHAVAPPDTASLSRIHELAGYDSLIHRDTVELLKDINHDDPAASANGNLMFVKPTADHAKLAEAGVTEIWRPEDTEPQPLAGPGRAAIEHGTCRIVDEGYDHITLEADGDGKLILRDRNIPGWTATLDGTPARITGQYWRSVDIPHGGHRVVAFRYRPPGLRIGIMFAGLGVLLLVVLFLPGSRPIESVAD